MKDTNSQGKSFQERLAEAEERRKNATISDIIAAKRREADSIEQSARGTFTVGYSWDDLPFTEGDLERELDNAARIRKEADRLEAALKRELAATAEKPSTVGDCAKLFKTVDSRFDICRDIEQVLKIGRDYQNKDGYRGAHYDTVKLLCDTIEYQQEQLKAKTEVGDAVKLREAVETLVDLVEAWEDHLPPAIREEEVSPALDKVNAVLAEPPRNCDNLPNADRAELEYRAFCERMGIDSSIYGAMAWMLADDTKKLEEARNDNSDSMPQGD